MAYSCQYCLKSFKRSYNRNRHEKQGCRLAYQPKENTTMTTISPENELTDIFSNDDKDNETVDRGIESGSEVEDEIDDPWEDLREKAKLALSKRYATQVELLMKQGASEVVAQAKAFNDLLPFFRAKLRRLYLQYLKWSRQMKKDPIHEEVMKTLKRFMNEEDEMDYEEAAEAAVDRRKFLLNRIFKPRPVPEEESTDEEEHEDETMEVNDEDSEDTEENEDVGEPTEEVESKQSWL